MTDICVTVPKELWEEWIGEGQLPGGAWSGEWEYSFSVGIRKPKIDPGERVYIVAHGRLRGYAPLVRIDATLNGYVLVRHGDAVAVTLPEAVRGFQGFRYRWWDRALEVPFPDWETAGVGSKIVTRPRAVKGGDTGR